MGRGKEGRKERGRRERGRRERGRGKNGKGGREGKEGERQPDLHCCCSGLSVHTYSEGMRLQECLASSHRTSYRTPPEEMSKGIKKDRSEMRGGWEEWREGERKGGREAGKERGREGGREGGKKKG